MPYRAFQALAALTTLACLASCITKSDPSSGNPEQPVEQDSSIVLDTKLRMDLKVENGTAFDLALVDPGDAKKVVLPDTATVRKSGEAGSMQLFLAKTLSFGGHPSEPITIDGARKNMGCALRSGVDALELATYGEWNTKEGGAHLKLLVIVPEKIEVEQRKGLSGPQSAAQGQSQNLVKGKDGKDEYWYGPASPRTGWSAIPSVPDSERTAGK